MTGLEDQLLQEGPVQPQTVQSNAPVQYTAQTVLYCTVLYTVQPPSCLEAVEAGGRGLYCTGWRPGTGRRTCYILLFYTNRDSTKKLQKNFYTAIPN